MRGRVRAPVRVVCGFSYMSSRERLLLNGELESSSEAILLKFCCHVGEA